MDDRPGFAKLGGYSQIRQGRGSCSRLMGTGAHTGCVWRHCSAEQGACKAAAGVSEVYAKVVY